MGLWILTTFLLIAIVFVTRIQAKGQTPKAAIESRQSGNGSEKEKVLQAFHDCVLYWQPLVSQGCSTPQQIMKRIEDEAKKNANNQKVNPTPAEMFANELRSLKESFEKFCDPPAQCGADGRCECPPNATCPSHTQDPNKDCGNQYLAAFFGGKTIEQLGLEGKTSVGSGFWPNFQVMVWTTLFLVHRLY